MWKGGRSQMKRGAFLKSPPFLSGTPLYFLNPSGIYKWQGPFKKSPKNGLCFGYIMVMSYGIQTRKWYYCKMTRLSPRDTSADNSLDEASEGLHSKWTSRPCIRERWTRICFLSPRHSELHCCRIRGWSFPTTTSSKQSLQPPSTWWKQVLYKEEEWRGRRKHLWVLGSESDRLYCHF